MDEDEYELTPHKQLEEMRKEIEILKKNPLAGTGSSKNLLAAMDNLSKQINKLIKIMSSAGEYMKEEAGEEEHHEDGNLSKKFDTLIDQNKKIAEGIVAVAGMLKKQSSAPRIRPLPGMPKPRAAPPKDIFSTMPEHPPSRPRPRMPPPTPGAMPPPMHLHTIPPPPSSPGGISPPPGPGAIPPLSPPMGEEPKKKKGLFSAFKK